MHDMPYCPVMERYVRIERNIVGIVGRLDNPRLSEARRQRLQATLQAQRAAAHRIAAILQGAPGQVLVLARPPLKGDEHPIGYGHGV